MIEDGNLRRFLSLALGAKEDEINQLSLDTRLVEDLKLDGDDFLEAVSILQREFGVDMSAFYAGKYCHEEGELLFPRAEFRSLKQLFGLKDGRSLQSVTLRMVQRVLEEKRWSS